MNKEIKEENRRHLDCKERWKQLLFDYGLLFLPFFLSACLPLFLFAFFTFFLFSLFLVQHHFTFLNGFFDIILLVFLASKFLRPPLFWVEITKKKSLNAITVVHNIFFSWSFKIFSTLFGFQHINIKMWAWDFFCQCYSNWNYNLWGSF